MNRLIVGDIHLPFTHPFYFQFCKDVRRKWKCKETIFIGDVTDQHALSFHEHDPDGSSAGNECDEAARGLVKWHKAFPSSKVCIGNHDARSMRVAKKAGLPMRFLKDLATAWDTPTWTWDFNFMVDGVKYTHGATSGKYAAFNLAVANRCSTAVGHTHTYGGVTYHDNDIDGIFGLNVGCGIDRKRYAFAYAKDAAVKPSLGVGVVVSPTEAHFVPMPCRPGEKYHAGCE